MINQGLNKAYVGHVAPVVSGSRERSLTTDASSPSSKIEPQRCGSAGRSRLLAGHQATSGVAERESSLLQHYVWLVHVAGIARSVGSLDASASGGLHGLKEFWAEAYSTRYALLKLNWSPWERTDNDRPRAPSQSVLVGMDRGSPGQWLVLSRESATYGDKILPSL